MKNKRKVLIEIEKRTVEKKTGQISLQFRIGPFKKTMGTTIGAALRRSLLSLSKTLAVTSVCGNFSGGSSIREDLFELSLNFQRIHVKSSFFPYIGIGKIRKRGPAIITAQDLELEEGLDVVNPHQYICTLNSSYNLNLQVMITSLSTNQGIDSIDPTSSFKISNYSSLKTREIQLAVTSNLDKPNPLSSLLLNHYQKRKKSPFKENERSVKNLKADAKMKLGIPQKLPLDIVIVDPIYSSIQSCGFEVVQTTSSSVKEYEEVVKLGVTDTEEFLKFVVISRGAIEPVIAIEFAAKELKENLSILEFLPHVFACKKNLLLSLEKGSQGIITEKIRKNIVNSYTTEVLKSLDLKHLNLPPMLELFLRQQGFVSLQSLTSVPLEFFKRIGLKEQNLKNIEESLNLFGLSINFNKALKWELIPNSLPV